MQLTKLTLTIEKLNSQGEGIARHEGPKGVPFGGKVCFVPWSVPGDKVLVQIEKERRDFNEARILEIIEKSPDRVQPRCPYFFECGGCQLQHLNYEAQLRWKLEIVRDALKRIARISDFDLAKIIPSPRIWNYRNRIQLHQDRHGRLGFYKKESHEVVEVEQCLIADEQINGKIKEVTRVIARSPEFVEGRRSLPAGKAGNPIESSGLLSARGACPPVGRRGPATYFGGHCARNDSGEFEIRVDNSEVFAQINPEQNEELVNQVVGMADPKKTDVIFELFCGDGNFTFPLAKLSRQVFAVEKNEKALDEARNRSRKEGIDNISWIHGTVFRTLVGLKREGATCDLMVVDPPRRGLAEALEGILSFKPKKIVYVSCDPATFARDAAKLTKNGYKLTQCQPVDMFPQTAHVEVAGLFKASGQ